MINLNRCCYLLLIFAAVGSIFTAWPFATWLLLVNALTLAIYGVDKMAARRAWRRVPEATLLAFGVLGGWAGAIAGQQLFRHKTQKAAVQNPIHHQHDRQPLRDGGDLFVLSFFFSLSSGEANGLQTRGMHSTRSYS